MGRREIVAPYTPADADIQQIIGYVQKNNRELEIPTLLAAYGGLRPGEICALRYEDIDGDTVHVRRSLKWGENNEWVEGDLKYPSDNHHIRLPEQVTALIGAGAGRIVDIDPTTLLFRFAKMFDRAGIKRIQFKELVKISGR